MSLYGYLGLRPKVKRTVQVLIQNILRGGCYNSCYYCVSASDGENSADSSGKKFDILRLKALHNKITSQNCESESYLMTIGSGAVGAPRSLFVCASGNRFVFNCGESVERVSEKFSKNLLHSSAVFFTSISLKNILGLNSILVRQEESLKLKERPYSLYGPTGLGPLINALPKPQKPPLIIIPVKSQRIDFGESVIIHPVAIFSSEVEEGSTNYAVAYICKLTAEKGIYTFKSFIDAGIPPGPWIEQLCQGKAGRLPDGREVTPDQLKAERCYKATTFIVIEIPSASYLDSLLSCSDFHPHHAGLGKLEEDFPEVIVHFSPPQVMKDPRYQQWANAFSHSVCHLVLNKNSTCLGLKRTISLQLQLNHLLPRVFPLLHNSNIPLVNDWDNNSNSEDLISPETLTEEYGFTGPTIQSSTLLRYYLRPNRKFNSKFCEAVDSQKSILSDFYLDDDVKAAVAHMSSKFEQLQSQLPKPSRPYPRILFLGTGSTPPTSVRSLSAILVHTDSDSCFLLDCGEGTFNQMIRLMGSQKTEATFRHLKFVYVSHHHFDHYIGLASVLKQRQKAFRNAGEKLPRIFLLLPDEHVKQYLWTIHELCEPILENVVIIDNVKLMRQDKHLYSSMREIYDNLALVKIGMCLMPHIRNSFGIALSHSNGWKLSYSGDTKPSNFFSKIGMDSDLLIHEATFEDDLADMARRKKHSTVSQAIAAGKNMNARFTLLTHFSQRYGTIPVLEKCPNDVGIAFDNMMVTLDDLPYLPHLYPVLKELFFKTLESHKNKIFRKKLLDS